MPAYHSPAIFIAAFSHPPVGNVDTHRSTRSSNDLFFSSPVLGNLIDPDAVFGSSTRSKYNGKGKFSLFLTGEGARRCNSTREMKTLLRRKISKERSGVGVNSSWFL